MRWNTPPKKIKNACDASANGNNWKKSSIPSLREERRMADTGAEDKMISLKYLSGYAPELQHQIQHMIGQDTLGAFL